MAKISTPLNYLDELGLRPLPAEAMSVLDRFDVPAQLLAHLALVHDVAAQLVDFLVDTWPDLTLDSHAVLIGAALHDIGKAAHPEELSVPGSAHEEAGVTMLTEAGVVPELARFARTHALSITLPEVTLEDMLVALADSCWKDQRKPGLEARITAEIGAALGIPEWEIFMALDDAIERIASLGVRRLAWQAQFAEK